MKIIDERDEWYAQRQLWVSDKIAFVPTMGNLHEGHLSLVRAARKMADRVVVSVYVNPLQFAPHEDFNTYPRTVEQDCEKLAALGVDVVILPTERWLYPNGVSNSAVVTVPELDGLLCGCSRPHFFQGVATVVLKLFQLVKPHLAVFGQKDFQQCLVIQQMVQDFLLDIEIVICPIVREANGLAMSSRNQYLSHQAANQAAKFHLHLAELAGLLQVKTRAHDDTLLNQTKKLLKDDGFTVDYLAVRTQSTLAHPAQSEQALVLLAAVYLNNIRLIDNIVFQASHPKVPVL